MKANTYFLFLISSLLSNAVQSTILTVSNISSSPGQFESIQPAIEAAALGDTIYVGPSLIDYGNIILNKRLTIIGGGFRNSSSTILGSITLDTLDNLSGASNSSFIGLKLNQPIYDYYGAKNIKIERCYLWELYVSGNNYVIINNLVRYIGLTGNAFNFIISNNIFHHMNDINMGIGGGNNPTINISNNLFIGTGSNYCFTYGGIQQAIISNNIFWGVSPASGVNYCAFNNNMTYQTIADTIPYGNNLGSGNLVGINPLFTSAPNLDLNFSYNYSLQPLSAGSDAGTDGTDIGVFGGSFPYPAITGIPRMPSITEFIIENSTIGLGGQINFQIKARKND